MADLEKDGAKAPQTKESSPRSISPSPERFPKAAQATLPTPAAYPPQHQVDHGLKAWLHCVGSFFLWFNTWALMNSYGVSQEFYERYLLRHKSASEISWIGSIQAILLMSVGVISGGIFDKGYFAHFISASAFLVVFGHVMASICTEYWQVVLAQGIIVGIGSGCIFTPSTAILPQYFLFDPKLFTPPIFSLATLGYFFVVVGVWDPNFYIDLWAIEYDIASPSAAAAILPALNAASIIGRIAPNYLADYMGSMNVAVLCDIIAAALLFCWLAVGSAPSTIVYAVFYGFFSGAVGSLLSPVIASIAPDPSRIGACMGTAFSAISIGALIGNLIVGAILRSQGSWTAFQATLDAFMTVGAGLTLAARMGKTGWRIGTKI